MMGFVRAAYVIGRRDFVATVFSRTFLFFLLGPLVIIGISILFGNLSERMARQDTRATVAVVAGAAEYGAIRDAHDRLVPAFGDGALPDLVRAEPDYVEDLQVKTLLASTDQKILAVLTGGIARPKLTGVVSETGSIRTQMALILDEARQQRGLAGAGIKLAPTHIDLARVEGSAGSLAATRALTARAAQLLLFTLTLLLAGMLLSNLVEEKSNKIIEVLAAAVPVDAIFVGKLFAMLAVSFVGVAVWATGAIAGIALWSSGAPNLPEPAVGWPLFVLLGLIYYSANYLLLGALFLGIGSQASSIREVQTLSMPVTVGQMLIFMLASLAVGPFNSLIGIGAAVFPFSSPMTMLGRAAQTGELWPHLLGIAWQAFWVWLTVQLAAALFRRNVMKSGGGSGRGQARPR
jgi:ABC-2 type transport system permease protein